jgi:hypothetical protein
MSLEMAAAFVEKVYSDFFLRQKLINLGTNPRVGAILDLAANYGYHFSQKDLVQALKYGARLKGSSADTEPAETGQAAVGSGLRPGSGLSSNVKSFGGRALSS